MSHPDYPHLFSPIRIGNFEVPNRVCHVPTDISSANADGSVNQRVITLPRGDRQGRLRADHRRGLDARPGHGPAHGDLRLASTRTR